MECESNRTRTDANENESIWNQNGNRYGYGEWVRNRYTGGTDMGDGYHDEGEGKENEERGEERRRENRRESEGEE